MSRAKMKFKPIVEDINGLSREELEARWELWRQGDLSWKLDECQLPIYDEILNQENMDSTLLISRRYGKSYTCLITEIEVCIQQPLIICKHACPTQKMVKEMIYPQLRIIFQDAPPEYDLDQMWNATEGKLKFPNGSFITIAGTDGNNADNLRGTYAHLAFCDEAAFMENLTYVVRQILRPQLLTTGGKIVLLSTPNPRDLTHEFHTEFVFPAEAAGKLIKMTIYDNKRLTKEEIEREIRSYPLGDKDPAFRAEYLVEIPKVSEASVFPEFSLNKHNIVDPNLELVEGNETYIAGDVGVRDLTAFVFGYYDYKNATLCILDEYISNGTEQTTEGIANAIKLKESINFKTKNGIHIPPSKRIMDNQLQMINDFNRLHSLRITATKKDNKFAAVNDLRDLFANGRVKIHPRCKHLIYHLEHAKWKDKKGIKAEFDRLADSMDGEIKGGHVDACFLPGTRVLTRNGYKNIEDVTPGTEVLTHLGGFKKVKHNMSKDYSGEIFNLKVKGKNTQINSTIDHRYFITNFKDKLPTNSYFSTLTNDENIRLFEPKLPNVGISNISNELAFLYGYWVAEGSLSGNKVTIDFAGSKTETNVIDILTKAARESFPSKRGVSTESIRRHKLGMNKPKQINVKSTDGTDNNGRRIRIGCKSLWSKLKPLGKSDFKKFPNDLYDLNREQSLYMLAGYLFGDGSFTKNYVRWSTISRDILDGVEYLFKKLGYIPNTGKSKPESVTKLRGKEYNTKLCYTAYLSSGQSFYFVQEILSRKDLAFVFEQKTVNIHKTKWTKMENTEYVTIDKLEKSMYSGKVYNLEVEEDESYCVEGIAVHNCDAILYMSRNINFNRRPVDASSLFLNENQHIRQKPEKEQSNIMSRLFGKRKK